jgi:hypothetical protein
MSEGVRIPVYADEEMMIWVYRLPAFLVLAFSVLIGIWTVYAVFTLPAGFAVALVIEKLTESKRPGYVQHKIYAMGLAEPSGGGRLFPPAFSKVFSS